MKAQYQKDIGLSPAIYIEQVDGSLQVKGWMRSEVFLTVEDELLDVCKENNEIHFRTHGDCVVRAPRGTSLHVGQVGGSARLKYLDGEIQLGQIYGSLAARSVRLLHIGQVHGDVLVKGVLEGITIQRVLGSFIAREMQGKCVCDQISGNFDGRGLSGSLAADVQGHARLEIHELLPEGVQLHADGHIHCETTDILHASVTLNSSAGDIQIHLPDEKRHCTDRTCTLNLGEGGNPIHLSAGGKVIFINRAPLWREDEGIDEIFNDEFERISEDFSRQFQAQMDSQMEFFNQQMQRLSEEMMRMGFSQPNIERLVERARQSNQQASARVQEKMRQAQAKLEQKMAAAQRKAEAKSGRRPSEKVSFSFGGQPFPAPEKPAASEEERLLILKMLEEKKITVEEAEMLLNALEG